MEDCIDATTSLPFKEHLFSLEGGYFSEFQRIKGKSSLKGNDKVQLLKIPTVRMIFEFVTNIFNDSNTENEVIIHLIILLQKVLKRTKWPFRPTNWRILVVTSLRVAIRAEDTQALGVLPIYCLYDDSECCKLEEVFKRLLKQKIELESQKFLQFFQAIAA